MAAVFLFLLVLVTWGYWLAAWWMVREFYSTPDPPPGGYRPPASILKPVKGIDPQALENFVSFCRQDYPEYEILFGVSDPTDPVIPIIQQLQRELPERTIRLYVAPPLGSNHKVAILRHLSEQARHELLVISDSDMRATPDYLQRIAAPLEDDRIGLVTCLYRGEFPQSLAARLESLYMAVHFLPSVIMGRRAIAMRFAVGATMALRRSDLRRLGGFEAIANYLADDYQLGSRIAALGLRVYLSHYIIPSVLGATKFRDQWDREVRWIRCARVSRPREYPGLLLGFTTPFALAFLAVSGLAPAGWGVLTASLILRWVLAWKVTGYTGDREVRRWLLWLPVRDVLTALVWCAGLVGKSTIWRGESFTLQRDGQMQSFPANIPEMQNREEWLSGLHRTAPR
jgi:ceramide glucosyltransferase